VDQGDEPGNGSGGGGEYKYGASHDPSVAATCEVIEISSTPILTLRASSSCEARGEVAYLVLDTGLISFSGCCGHAKDSRRAEGGYLLSKSILYVYLVIE
jgi:hypothetical protein